MFDVTLTVKCDLGVFIDGGNRIFGAQKEPYQFPIGAVFTSSMCRGWATSSFLTSAKKARPLYASENRVDWEEVGRADSLPGA